MLYVTNGAWGTGVGYPPGLSAAEVDQNFYDVELRLTALETSPPAGVGVANIAIDGLAWVVTLTDATVLDPLPIPIPLPRWRGEWVALTEYATMDEFSVADTGIFITLAPHTSVATFNADEVGAAVAATAISPGLTYVIATVGTTDFTLIGAASNTLGLEFIATDAGAGTGTATPKFYQQLSGVTAGAAVSELDDATLPVDPDALIELSEPSGSPPSGYESRRILVADLLAGLALDDATISGATLSGSTTLSGFTAGSVLFAGASGVLSQDNAKLYWDDTNTRFGFNTNTPDYLYAGGAAPLLNVHGGSSFGQISLSTSATASSSSTGVLAFGTTGTASAVKRAAQIGATLTADSSTNVSGTLSFLTNLNGTLTTVLQLTPNAASDTGTQRAFLSQPAFVPTGASLSAIEALNFTPTINSNSLTIATYRGILVGTTLGASFSGTVTLAEIFCANTPTVSGGSIANLVQFEALATANGNGASSGTITNTQFRGLGITAGSAGGTVNNRTAQFTVPSGGSSSGTTSNRGVFITGNGGSASGGTVNNHALYSDSTARSYLAGALGVGTTTDPGVTGALLAGVSLMIGGTDLILQRDAANVLAQYNSTTAQVSRIYNTRTDASNYERAALDWATTSNWFRIGTSALGTGTARNIYLDPAGGIVGISGATSSFPALKRSSTALEVKLADDSAYAPLSSAAHSILPATSIPAGGTAGAGLKFSSTSNFGVFFGSGAPSLSAAKGSLYLRSDGSGTTDRAYINTDGGTTWTALTTVA